ncbi:MAG: MFS transporter [Chloroflexi bacterium]|nr:MFS transporter [Chloroflexota bacterium]
MNRSFRFHYGWIIVFVSFTALLVGNGSRVPFGVFFKPMIGEFGWDRASASLAVSIGVLVYGLLQPLMGKAVDHFGARRVVIASTFATGIGTVLIAATSDLWQLYISYGIIASIGAGGLGFTTLTVLIANWFSTRRGLAMGISQAGFPASQLFMVPLSMFLIVSFGWRMSWAILAILFVTLMLPLSIYLLKGHPADLGLRPYGSAAAPVSRTGASAPAAGARREKRTSLTQAMRTASFWQLAFGYGVCGFTVSMVTTHLVAYASDVKISEVDAANALGLMGGLNIVGTMLIGALTDRIGNKNPLAFIYFTRGIAFIILLAVTNVGMLYLFAAVFGFAFLATVPPTAGLSADLYGRGSLGVIYGTVSLSHQTGGAIGAYLAGAIFDTSGSYHVAFVIGTVACFAAAAASYTIKEKRVPDAVAAA